MSIYEKHVKSQENDFYLRKTSYLMQVSSVPFREELTSLYNTGDHCMMAVATILNAIYTEGKPTFFMSRRVFEALLAEDSKNLSYKSRKGIPSGNPTRAAFIKVMEFFRNDSHFVVHSESNKDKKTPACVGLVDEVMLRSMGDQMTIKLASNWHQMAIKTLQLMEIAGGVGKVLPDSISDSISDSQGRNEGRKSEPDDKSEAVVRKQPAPGPPPSLQQEAEKNKETGASATPANGKSKASWLDSIRNETGPSQKGSPSRSLVSILNAYPTVDLRDFESRYEDIASCCSELKREGYTREQVLSQAELVSKKWFLTSYRSKDKEQTGKQLVRQELARAISEVFPTDRFKEPTQEVRDLEWVASLIRSNKLS